MRPFEGGTFVSAAGGTFETVIPAHFIPLPSYEGDYSRPLDDFLPATLKERVWTEPSPTVSDESPKITPNLNKHSPKKLYLFGECFIVFEYQYGGADA